jgi:hypothetical protein
MCEKGEPCIAALATTRPRLFKDENFAETVLGAATFERRIS